MANSISQYGMLYSLTLLSLSSAKVIDCLHLLTIGYVAGEEVV